MTTENITDKTILKSWFRRGLKPLGSQFHAWMDAYWHKQEKIPTAAIEGLEETLNNKIEKEQLLDLQNKIVITGKETETELLLKFLPYLDRILSGEEVNLKISYRLIQGEGWIGTYDTVVLTEIIQSDNTPGIYFYINTIYDLHSKNPWHGPVYSSTELEFGKKKGNWFFGYHNATTTQLDPIPIYDALDCTDNHSVLSARQGNVLSKSLPLILPVDFRQPYAQIKQSLADAARPYFADGSIHTRPVCLMYIWKKDYTKPDTTLRYAIIQNPEYITGGISFNSPQEVHLPGSPFSPHSFSMDIIKTSDNIEVSLGEYTNKDKHKPIFLYENSDCIISTGEQTEGADPGGWTVFNAELKAGNTPDVYLKTLNSGLFCPATYNFTPKADSPTTFTGCIEISYLHKSGETSEWWIERLEFDSFAGLGSQYNSNGLTKIPVTAGVITIPVNFGLPGSELENSISAFVAPYFADGSIYRCPVYLLYIWKNSYTDPASETRNLLVSPSEISHGRIFFNSTQKTIISGSAGRHAYSFEITKTDDGIETVWDDYIPPTPKHSTIFLYDNGDHTLSISDQTFPGVDLSGWTTFANEIIAVRTPIVYLRTDNSGAFCPATYSFDPLPDSPTTLAGYIEISYIKKTDTGKQLWIERLEFPSFTGDGSLYNYIGNELYDGVTKIPIP